MLLLDDSSPEAHVVDPVVPPSAASLRDALVATWPRLGGRVRFQPRSIEAFALTSRDVVVSSHACGALTDRVLDRAGAAGARVAVLPCCHDLGSPIVGALSAWVDGALAIDLHRAWALERRGYRVWTQMIPAAITPKNRLLIGTPQ